MERVLREIVPVIACDLMKYYRSKSRKLLLSQFDVEWNELLCFFFGQKETDRFETPFQLQKYNQALNFSTSKAFSMHFVF